MKSLRGISLSEVDATSHGFPYDRRFMFFKGSREEQIKESARMTVTYFSQMVLYQPNLLPLEDRDGQVAMTITYSPPGAKARISKYIPLMPDITELEEREVSLHRSPTKAFIMQDELNAWFSECFGFDVMLVYLGPNLRPVLGNLSPNVTLQQGRSWLSGISATVLSLYSSKEAEGLTFTDVAPYLIVTEESLHEVSSRLPEGQDMDITKFRPNIVLSGADAPYDEDYWGGLNFSNPKTLEVLNKVDFILTANCARCVSINIDYSTGEPGKGEDGSILKKMMKDRRVDRGTKYSPIFGRYAFLQDASVRVKSRIRVGDEVTVSKRNVERTTFGKSEHMLWMK